MRQASAALGSALFFLVAPGTIAGFVPWRISHWRPGAPIFGSVILQAAGWLLMICGAAVLLETFARFVREGKGTPAPVAPPRHLVVKGLYRFVRNPMYVAIFAIVLGQALVFLNVRLGEYAAAIGLGFHLWVLVYEEPTLRNTFADEYREYSAQVPRWVPRLTAWRSPG